MSTLSLRSGVSLAGWRQWYRARPPRERLILQVGAVVVPLLILYYAIWDPLMTSRAQLAKELPLLRENAARVAFESDEIERLRGRVPGRDASRSPRAAIESSAARMNISLMGIESSAADRTIVLMSTVPFDALSRWLADLASAEGMMVESLQLTAAGEGQVRVDRLILVPASRRGAPAPAARS